MIDVYAFATPNSVKVPIARNANGKVPVLLDSDAPHVARWYAALEARPAFQRGVAGVNALVPQ